MKENSVHRLWLFAFGIRSMLQFRFGDDEDLRTPGRFGRGYPRKRAAAFFPLIAAKRSKANLFLH